VREVFFLMLLFCQTSVSTIMKEMQSRERCSKGRVAKLEKL
jgi:hypothetical protein